MKILIINETGIKGGGAETRIKSLIKRMIKDPEIDQIHLLEISKKTISHSSKKIFHHKCSLRSSYGFVDKILLNYNIDLVQVHNIPRSFGIPLIPVLKRKVPMIFYAHDYWPICPRSVLMNPFSYEICNCEDKKRNCFLCAGIRSWIRYKINRFFINKADYGIAPGKKCISIFESNGMLKGKWKIVQPWITVNKELDGKILKKDKDFISILFVGALMPYKGAHVFAEAIKILKRKDIHVFIIGDNQEPLNVFRQHIEKIFDGLPNVKFLGHYKKKELYEFFSQTDILIMPSVCSEMFGLVWAEAAYFGNFVIGSSVGGLPEYLGEIGFIFKKGDFNDLANKINFCIENKLYKDKKLLEKNRTFIKENFFMEKAYEKIKNLYVKEILKC